MQNLAPGNESTGLIAAVLFGFASWVRQCCQSPHSMIQDTDHSLDMNYLLLDQFRLRIID